MYYQIEQKLKEIESDEKSYVDDKAMLFGCKLELVDLCLRIASERERLSREKKETKDAEKQQKLNEEIAALDNFFKEKKLEEKRDEALEYIQKTSPMYKKLYESGARLGIDYIVIPNGVAYHFPATSPDSWPKRSFLDYEKLGYEKGKPCDNYNSGACVVFDGEDLILTCDYSLYESIIKDSHYEKRGWIPFYNGGQQMYFESISLERQFEEMIKQTKGNNYQRIPLGLGDQKSYAKELHWKLIRQNGHNEKGFYGPRRRRRLPTENDDLRALVARQKDSYNH